MGMIIGSVLNRMKADPVRGISSLLGIAIGFAVVTLVVNVAYHANRAFDPALQGGGTIVAFAHGRSTGPRSFEFLHQSVLTSEDIAAVRSQYPAARGVAEIENRHVERILVGETYYRPRRLLSVGVEYAEVYRLEILNGTFFSSRDIEDGNRVAVLSQESAVALYGGAGDAVGSAFTVMSTIYRVDAESGQTTRTEAGETYTVIGVFSTPTAFERETHGIPDFLLPFGITDAVGPVAGRIGTFVVRSTEPGLSRVQSSVTGIIAARHSEEVPLVAWEGNPQHPGSGGGMRAAGRPLSLFFGAFGFLALVISSFGVFSLMMVSVTERTREIGLRRAMGSTAGRIVLHFLGESIVVSMMGSAMGLVFAVALNRATINSLAPMLTQLGMSTEALRRIVPEALPMAIALAAMLVSGALFGILPAVSASRVPPVVSLREG